MSSIYNEYEYYLTPNHFSQVDFDKQLTVSDSDISSSNNSNSDSDSDSDSSLESGYSSNSGSNGESGSDSESGSESESESESEKMEIDQDDLFNTKTNGHEFFGEVLKNRYLILKKLGYGSFSSVWMAYDINNTILVAIKIINPQDYKEGMLELETYKKLDKLDTTYLLTMIECFQVTPIHPKYYDDDFKAKNKKLRNHIVMVLPLMACSTFDLLKCKEYDDGLPLEVCKKIIHQTLLGIKELEKNNLMHTDLKPENILVVGLNREAEILLQTIKDINIKKLHENQLTQLISDKKQNNDPWIVSYQLYKEITKTIIKFIKTDMQDVKDQMKLCKVSSKYIKDIKIKICDFNLVLDAKENIGDLNIEIQTRYYRAPEIILGAGLHPKTDYWSIGCVFFELLTGEILFDPEKDKKISRDEHHIYLIEELMGQIPKVMIENCTKKDVFDSNGFLLNVGKKIKRWDLQNVFRDNHDNVGLNEAEINMVIKYINNCLHIIPDNRPNINNLIKYLYI